MGFPCCDIALYFKTMGQGTAPQPGCVRDRDSLSRQCGVELRRDRESHARARQTRSGAHAKVGAPRVGVHDRGIMS